MDTYDKIQEELEGLLVDSEELQFTMASLLDLKKAKLVELCKEEGLASYGTKQQLAERLIEEFGNESVLEATSNIIVVQEERNSDESTTKGKRV